MKAFYFATEDRKLRYNDGRSIVVGETHKVEGTPVTCHHGLHANERLIDALRYAHGAILYRVELSGEFDVVGDKIAATERKYLAEFDATDVLCEFVRRQAMINIELIKPHCSGSDYDLIVQYLTTGDESTRAAAEAAAEAAANEMLTEMVREATGWDI